MDVRQLKNTDFLKTDYKVEINEKTNNEINIWTNKQISNEELRGKGTNKQY